MKNHKDQSNACLKLVGAGPGDPELITLKALVAMQTCDIVLYDSLVDNRVFDLAYANSQYEHISDPNELSKDHNDRIVKLFFVGKRRGQHSLKQDEINQLILSLLKQNKTIVRLKGGDPFVFARGVEELYCAREAGYTVEVVPGLTSGLSLASHNSIPLTIRDKSDSITLATGHEIDAEKLRVWNKILKRGSTLVIYMGLFKIVDIIASIADKQGLDFPITVISNGSMRNEHVIESTAGDILQELINQDIKSPVIIIAGQHIRGPQTSQNPTESQSKDIANNAQQILQKVKEHENTSIEKQWSSMSVPKNSTAIDTKVWK